MAACGICRAVNRSDASPITVVFPAPIEPEITSILGVTMAPVWTLVAAGAAVIAITHGSARAQSTINSIPAESRLAAGESRDYIVDANAGEYLSIAVDSKGIGVDAHVAMPDGALMRRF